MTEWKELKISELIEKANTGLDAIKRAPIVVYNSGIKCLRIQDVSQKKPFQNWGFCEVTENNFKRFQLKKGEIIIARTGATIGVNLLIQNDLRSVFNNGLIRIKVNEEKITPEFLFYQFQSSYYRNYIESISGGTSTQPNMQINVLLDFEISVPSLPEQQIIGDTLSGLDEKINLLQRQNKILEALAETLFRQWFIEEAEDGWEEKGLDEIAEFLNGLACQKYPAKAGEVGLPVIKIKELRTGITDASDIVTNDVPEKYLVHDGDMLFSWSGSLDIVIWSGGKGVLNQHLFKVSSTEFPQWFYYFWVKHHLPEFQGIAEDKATTMGHIQRHHLSNARVLVPPENSLNKMGEVINPTFEKIKKNQAQIQTLIQLRDTLLPKLMSGEIRV